MNSDEKVIDPVCGMTVAPTSPHKAEHAGRSYGFCSDGCRASSSQTHCNIRTSTNPVDRVRRRHPKQSTRARCTRKSGRSVQAAVRNAG